MKIKVNTLKKIVKEEVKRALKGSKLNEDFSDYWDNDPQGFDAGEESYYEEEMPEEEELYNEDPNYEEFGDVEGLNPDPKYSGKTKMDYANSRKRDFEMDGTEDPNVDPMYDPFDLPNGLYENKIYKEIYKGLVESKKNGK
ncbi:hypothetical protein M0R19_04245 [Candidatus Pacearchaeota archaeon]|nr:hypothetical protein [Candidatus Pacearchaeota archaeon]